MVWQVMERNWSIVLTEGEKNLAFQVIYERGVVAIVAKISNSIAWQSTMSAKMPQFLILLFENRFYSRTSSVISTWEA